MGVHHDQQTPTPAEGRYDDALGEQLPNQPATPGAQRSADRHLVLTCGRPNQKKVGDVHTGQYQHQGSQSQEESCELWKGVRRPADDSGRP
jgi:hypothetical protein